MTDSEVLRKDQLEIRLHNEKKLIHEGALKDENPLDFSEGFRQLCDACRKGDLKVCQEKISEGVNINARDSYDYTPLILASLCGHFEVVQLLLESGALCERDTFQGERCLYNALNDRIRNLLLKYDYSKSTDPLQPFAAHISSLLTRDHPVTSDIIVTDGEESLFLHKFILSARSPYFQKKLAASPDSTSWKIPNTLPPAAFASAIRYIYLGDSPRELRAGPGTGFTESEVVAGVDRIGRHLEIPNLLVIVLESGDRRLARQRRADELARGRDQFESWFESNVLGHKVVVETAKANDVKWDRSNGIFADVLLRADELSDGADPAVDAQEENRSSYIPVGPGGGDSTEQNNYTASKRMSVLYPVHRAMLLRSEFFGAMFSSIFKEAQVTEHLNIISVDCSPEVLEIVLRFFYTEKADFPLDIATKAAVVISSLGSANMSQAQASKTRPARQNGHRFDEKCDEDEIDIYEIIRAGWLTRVQRLEEFGARYLAYRLEEHIDTEEFAELIKESAGRIQKRQETDSIELLDDIRFYLSERFRLRFDDAGLAEMIEENQPQNWFPPDAQQTSDSTTVTDDMAKLNISPERHAKPEEVVPGDHPNQADDHVAIIRTLDGAVVEDEFDQDAMNYNILLDKLDRLLERLNLEA
ncbi:ankyrin repeat and BTB/POZ domain protein [Talaromyces stipitatus ATCC 10500]|uniref:Ankyrin repeat and BTB/POZ domain protein n=1 Tax=Talaromyces stipitatus (strain ATCC 10500 / CBS 375.48 / QM 6759 / NRRL 1006) TaxID=441959 RepID=B8MKY1_TALSN|nr:ankyrin repeat and BTB/POZ domain protein [Talaromyces stipitatus ATCC 10500]EED15397.1 ankyrin repeat and BTB/POZ domain protein [Talaromyces stipitatus ATCC 10500]